MKNIKLFLFVLIACLLHSQGNGFAETMYVTDRLYLSLRNAPEAEQPTSDLLLSDTEVDVLETKDKWARVRLKDGRTGWVWKKYLVQEVPKTLIIEQLEGKIESQSTITERLRQEIVSRDREIEALKTQITQQSERFQASAKENASKRRNVLYITGIVTLAVGFVIGYLARRPKKPDLGFLPTAEIRQRLLGS